MVIGLIYGMILRYWKLCSRVTDVRRRMKTFFRRLLRRGYSKDFLIPLFKKAVENAHKHIRRSPQEFKAMQDRKLVQGYRRVFFHLQYHPNDPSSKIIQRVWRKQVMFPNGKRPLNELVNVEDQRIPIDQLTIAYSRAPNFGNLFSVRKFHMKRGPNVSSLI